MQMEISGIEIHILCNRISDSTQEYFLSGIYSMEDGVLLRFNHATKPEKLVAISSFATWLTTKNLSLPQATKFVSRLRDQIERHVLQSVEQVGNERIARFALKSAKGEARNLFAEFFGHGNLILTDPLKDETIIDVATAQSFRHRTVAPGEKYVLPPSRGIPLQEIDKEHLVSIFSAVHKVQDTKISAIKWFGRNVGTSRKFVEEIFKRAGIESEILASVLDDENISALASACTSLKNELEQSASGHVLLPTEDSELEVDVCLLVPFAWKDYSQEGLATIHDYPSLSEALDDVQIQELILRRQRKASREVRAKAAELASAIAKQRSLIEKNRATAGELRTIASSLFREGDAKLEPDLLKKLESDEILETSGEQNNQLRFVSEPRAFLSTFTPTSFASRLFDEAKRLESSNVKIGSVLLDLESQERNLTEQSQSQEKRAEKNLVTERRERQWYERYRWFVTSQGRLVVGGRDSTSNSVVINKHMEKNDIVFHADLHGSPFFVLKHVLADAEHMPDDETSLEVAQATVSFSRAWKDELGSADAFWVLPDQIKKSAPSGEYLPRGSFFIEGKKNFIRHVKTELSVGVAPVGVLPKEEGLEVAAGSKPDSVQIVVVCGPDKSLGKYCFARVKIAPGKEKTSDFARKIKQQLVKGIKDNIAKEQCKRLTVDEIIRVLPSGTYKLVSEKGG